MIIRIKKVGNYSVIDNTGIQDKDLSWGAKGLLVYLLHLPDDWNINVQDLKNRSTNGRDSTRRFLNELIKYKYVIKEKARNKTGTFAGYDYTVYEQPQTGNPSTDIPKTDNPNTGNTTLLNTNLTNELNKPNIKYKKDSITVLNHLNAKTGHNYRPVNGTLSNISARLKEGYTVEDCKKVIDIMTWEWEEDETMRKYLDYETLFRKSKFPKYLEKKKGPRKVTYVYNDGRRETKTEYPEE